MYQNILNMINQKFSFLIDAHGYSGPFQFKVAREFHVSYTKALIVILISWEAAYWTTIYKTTGIFPEILDGTKHVLDLDHSKYVSRAVMDLVPRRTFLNKVSKMKPEERLSYEAGLLREFPEILVGDLRAFSTVHRLNRRMRGLWPFRSEPLS